MARQLQIPIRTTTDRKKEENEEAVYFSGRKRLDFGYMVA